MPKLFPKNSFNVKVKFYGDWKRFRILNKQLEQRFKAFCRLFVIESAKWYLKELLRKAPVELIKSYKAGAAFYQLSSPIKIDGKDTYVQFLAIEPPAERDILTLDKDTTLLYVDIDENAPFINEIVIFLKNNSPWTLDTIPLIPTKKDGAIVKYRFAKVNEVNVIRDDKIKNFERIKSFFDRKNIKIPIRNVSRMVTAKDDMISRVLRYEFGTIGSKKKPHWRIASRNYFKYGMYKIMNSKKLLKTLFDSGYSAWRTIPQFSKTSISMLDTARNFMSKIKVSIPRRKILWDNEKILERRLKMIKRGKFVV